MVEHLVLNGATVRISTSGNFDVSQPPTSFLVIDLSTHLQEFGSGSTDYGRISATRSLGIASFDERYFYQNGTLLIGSSKWTEQGTNVLTTVKVAVWEGSNFSVRFHLYNAKAADELIAISDLLKIEELDRGVRLRLLDAQATPLVGSEHSPRLMKFIPDVGHLEIFELSQEFLNQVPSWPGLPVRGGELFVVDDATTYDDGSPQVLYVLVGPSSFTRIYPWAPASQSKVLEGIESLSVVWQSAEN